MTHMEFAESIETIKYLCEHKRAGTPKELAKKFNISERTLLRIIKCLPESGHPVSFNRFRKTYEIKEKKF